MARGTAAAKQISGSEAGSSSIRRTRPARARKAPTLSTPCARTPAGKRADSGNAEHIQLRAWCAKLLTASLTIDCAATSSSTRRTAEQLPNRRKWEVKRTRPLGLVETGEPSVLEKTERLLVLRLDKHTDTAKVTRRSEDMGECLTKKDSPQFEAARTTINRQPANQRNRRWIQRQSLPENLTDLFARNVAHAECDEPENCRKRDRILRCSMEEPCLADAVGTLRIPQSVAFEEVIESMNAAVEISDEIVWRDQPEQFAAHARPWRPSGTGLARVDSR